MADSTSTASAREPNLSTYSTLHNSALYRRESMAQGFSFALGAAACVLLLFVAYQLLSATASIATPFIVGIAFALLLEPLVNRISAQVTRGRRGRAVILTFLIFLVGFGGLLGFVLPNVISQASDVAHKFPASFDAARDWVDNWLAGQGVVVAPPKNTGAMLLPNEPLTESARRFVPLPLTPEGARAAFDFPGPASDGATPRLTQPRQTNAPPASRGRNLFGYTLPPSTAALLQQFSGQISNAARVWGQKLLGALAGGAGALFSLLLSPLVTLYVLADLPKLRARLFFLFPERIRATARRHADATGQVFGSYLRGMGTICALYAVAATVSVLVAGFFFDGLRQNAVLIGVVCGLFYAVPVLGPLVMVTFAVVVTAATGNPWPAIVTAAAIVFVLNFIFDNFLMPRLVGGSVGLHPLVSLFALLIGGQVLGVVGMLISIPVAASIQIVLFQMFPRLAAPIPLSHTNLGEMKRRLRQKRGLPDREPVLSNSKAASETDPHAERLILGTHGASEMAALRVQESVSHDEAEAIAGDSDPDSAAQPPGQPARWG